MIYSIILGFILIIIKEYTEHISINISVYFFIPVSISFENYRVVHPAYRDDEEEEDEVDPDEIENRKSAWGNSLRSDT